MSYRIEKNEEGVDCHIYDIKEATEAIKASGRIFISDSIDKLFACMPWYMKRWLYNGETIVDITPATNIAKLKRKESVYTCILFGGDEKSYKWVKNKK